MSDAPELTPPVESEPRLDLAVLEHDTRDRLSDGTNGYYRPAGEESTIRVDVEPRSQLRLRPRILADLDGVSTATTVLATGVSATILVAPLALQRLLHDRASSSAPGGRGRRRRPLCVLADGGIRRGTDVLRALALGAWAVLVGRPVAWELATSGAAGARRVLAGLTLELAEAMALPGSRPPDGISGDLVRKGVAH